MKTQLSERSEAKLFCLNLTLTPSKDMYYVYILKGIETGGLYYGYSNNLERRFAEHNKERFRWVLVYYEAYKSELDARNRERRLKHYAQALVALKSRLKESLK